MIVSGAFNFTEIECFQIGELSAHALKQQPNGYGKSDDI
jgi:hypothetical protein